MRQSIKISVLVALVAATVGLSVAVFGLRQGEAQVAALQDGWVADDARQAVNALLNTGTYSYQDRVLVPGMYRNAPLPKNIKGLKSKTPGLKVSGERGSFSFKAIGPEAKAYTPKSAFPKIVWKPTKTEAGVPAVQLKGGVNGTKFKTPDGLITKKTTTENVITDRAKTKANKFAVSLKSPKTDEAEKKTAKIPITKAQLRAFKARIKATKKDGAGIASALYAGSLNDEPALFVPIVRVRRGVPTDFRIAVTPQ